MVIKTQKQKTGLHLLHNKNNIPYIEDLLKYLTEQNLNMWPIFFRYIVGNTYWVDVWFGPHACIPSAAAGTRTPPGDRSVESPGRIRRCNTSVTVVVIYGIGCHRVSRDPVTWTAPISRTNVDLSQCSEQSPILYRTVSYVFEYSPILHSIHTYTIPLQMLCYSYC